MRRHLACVFVSMLLFCAFSAQGADAPAKPPWVTAEMSAIAEGNNAFAFDLYAKLAGAKDAGNLFFSPNSISTALAMTYAGARGKTADQMKAVMHYDLEGDKLHKGFGEIGRYLTTGDPVEGAKKADGNRSFALYTANALWGQKGYEFLPAFTDLNKRFYGAGLNDVDFAHDTEGARKIINTWVEKQTNDKIKELLQPGVLTDLTRLVLTNAIYFKAQWQHQFNEKATRPLPFKLLTGKPVDVPMMHQTEKFRYAEGDTWAMLELPYKDNEQSMIVLLPKADDGLAALEKDLNLKNLNDWMGKQKSQHVDVTLPKFEMTCPFKLAETLQAMGMKDAFAGGVADFSGMTGKKALVISEVIHKAFVKVDETGTEAAAATAVIMEEAAERQQPIRFTVDHPFFFLIRDNATGSILFAGRVVDPTK